MPTITEVFAATEHLGPVNYVFPVLRSRFVKIASIPVVKVGVVVTDSFVASSTATERAYMLASEQFFAQDYHTKHSRSAQHISDSIRVSTKFTTSLRTPGLASDSFVATGSATHPVIRFVARETFRVSDNVVADHPRTVTVLERFTARGSATGKQHVVVHDVFVATDGYAIGGTNRLTVTETFSVSSTASPRRNDFALVTESFSAADSFTITIQARARVHELFRVADFVHGRDASEAALGFGETIPLSATSAWTADMMTWGMSRYVGLPVNEFDAVQYGVSASGVFRPVEQPVLSFVETGDMALTDPESRRDTPIRQRKRINYVYTHSSHPRELNVLVTADHNGSRLTTEYTQDARDSSDTRAVRCSIGRGYASNYIKLRVGGESMFDMAALEIETTVTQRRI